MNPENTSRARIAFERKNAEMNMRSIIGHNLRKFREECKLSQHALGLQVGMTQSAVSHMESGECNPTIVLIERFAKALNVSPAQLLNADKDAQPR